MNPLERKKLSSRMADRIFIAVLILKLTALALFSSNSQNHLFLPFVDHSVSSFANPWQFFYELSFGLDFPFSSFMLSQKTLLSSWSKSVYQDQDVVLTLLLIML